MKPTPAREKLSMRGCAACLKQTPKHLERNSTNWADTTPKPRMSKTNCQGRGRQGCPKQSMPRKTDFEKQKHWGENQTRAREVLKINQAKEATKKTKRMIEKEEKGKKNKAARLQRGEREWEEKKGN